MKADIETVTVNEVMNENVTCLITDEDTAMIVGDMLGISLKPYGQNMQGAFKPGDVIYVARLFGGQTSEGIASLPYCAVNDFIKISLV